MICMGGPVAIAAQCIEIKFVERFHGVCGVCGFIGIQTTETVQATTAAVQMDVFDMGG